ncbi:hypothetical protein [Streptomyces sp. NPDC090445]|uniref:hypothetical protein n=1 Tax=Streptomyces sp. NPDC090445 TaxID=3365963 RepID=UPI00382F1926
MDFVYASLHRRQPAEAAPAAEAAEVVDALWAHALPGDGLQHVSARAEPDRVDVLLYLLSTDSPDALDGVDRAHTLITRSRQTSSVLRRRYLPPEPSSAPAVDRASL